MVYVASGNAACARRSSFCGTSVGKSIDLTERSPINLRANGASLTIIAMPPPPGGDNACGQKMHW